MINHMNLKKVPEDLHAILSESGFRLISIRAVVDSLAEMEAQMQTALGKTPEELDVLLQRLESLVGTEEAVGMSLNDIIGWLRALDN